MSKKKYWESFEKHADGIRDLPLHLKWFWQRRTRGFDDRDLWNLDNTIIQFIYPRLKVFRDWQCEHGYSYPSDLDPASWLEVLNKMTKAFELLSDPNSDIEVVVDKTKKAQIEEGLGLFTKHLRDLWD